MSRCRVPNCSGVTEYDDSARELLCTTCGTVSTQDVLTHEWDGELSGSSLYFGPITLKSLRRVGGALVGQSSKEDRDRRNTTAMHQYILNVTNKLAFPGLAPRACNLFDTARLHGKYRWGKRALLVAGACIAVVLRENKKGVMMCHLAIVMDTPTHALCRAFMQVCTLLDLQVPPFDPITILPNLQLRLMTLMTSPNSPLPKSLINALQSLVTTPVLHLAYSLAALLSELDDFSPGPAACPTACAIFIIALEGQAGSSLPSYTVLAQCLASHVGARKDLVTGRYRDITKLLEDWMIEVPWLTHADDPSNRLGKRRKSSQRDIVAKGIKDVIQFREDIQATRKARQAGSPITVALEVEEDESDDSYSSIGDSTVSLAGKRKRSEELSFSHSSSSLRVIRPRQKKSPLSQIDIASLSLLSPSHPLGTNSRSHATYPEEDSVSHVDVLKTRILTSSAFPSELTTTRLQRLVAARGGENWVEDSELFEEGELEGFFRNEDEVVKLRDLFGWEEPTSTEDTGVLFRAPSSKEWDLSDINYWEDVGSGKDIDSGEQILGEWREASPNSGAFEQMDNSFDVHGEW